MEEHAEYIFNIKEELTRDRIVVEVDDNQLSSRNYELKPTSC